MAKFNTQCHEQTKTNFSTSFDWYAVEFFVVTIGMINSLDILFQLYLSHISFH